MVTVRSCAAIFGVALDSVANGTVVAVVVTFVVALFTEPPEFTAATEKANVGSTDAVTVIESVFSIANATVAVSIVVGPVSRVVRRTKYVVSTVVGLVMPAVTGIATACTVCVLGVVTVRVIVQSVLPVPVQLELVPDAAYPVPSIPVTVPSVGEAVRTIPDGAVQEPEAVVQYCIRTVFIAVVDAGVKLNVCP